WRRLLQAQLAGGTQALVVAGSTGEAAALDDAEYDLLLRSAVELVGGRVPVLAGTGHSATARTIATTRRAAALGADAALVVTPPYVRPTAAGLLAHYRAVADECGLPVVMYNVPQRTGFDLRPAMVAGLVAHPRIVGVNEALADPQRLKARLALMVVGRVADPRNVAVKEALAGPHRLKDRPALRAYGLAVLGGDDAPAARAGLDGADGVVSVASNLAPGAMRLLCGLAPAGR